MRLDSTIRMAVEGYDAVLGRKMGLAQEQVHAPFKGTNREDRHNGEGPTLTPQLHKRARRSWHSKRSRNGRLHTRKVAGLWFWTHAHALRDERIQRERMTFGEGTPCGNPPLHVRLSRNTQCQRQGCAA